MSNVNAMGLILAILIFGGFIISYGLAGRMRKTIPWARHMTWGES